MQLVGIVRNPVLDLYYWTFNFLAIFDAIGCISAYKRLVPTLPTQIAALAVSDATFIPDLVCTGIWGGAFLVLFASCCKNEWKPVNLLIPLITAIAQISHKFCTRRLNTGTIKALAVYSMLIGFTLIGLHAWNVSSYSEFIDRCEWFQFRNEIGLCK